MVRSVHEFARYTKLHIGYNILMPRKLCYPASLWSWKCQISAVFTVTICANELGCIWVFCSLSQCKLPCRQRHRTLFKLYLLPVSCWFLAWFTLEPWRWGLHVDLQCQLTLNGLLGIISWRTDSSLTTAVRTSNSTNVHIISE
jgi:hypothetical protein